MFPWGLVEILQGSGIGGRRGGRRGQGFRHDKLRQPEFFAIGGCVGYFRQHMYPVPALYLTPQQAPWTMEVQFGPVHHPDLEIAPIFFFFVDTTTHRGVPSGYLIKAPSISKADIELDGSLKGQVYVKR